MAFAVAVFMLAAAAAMLGRWFYVALGMGESVDDSGRRRLRTPEPYVAKENASDTLAKRIRAARNDAEHARRKRS
jgi:hypothetical protein